MNMIIRAAAFKELYCKNFRATNYLLNEPRVDGLLKRIKLAILNNQEVILYTSQRDADFVIGHIIEVGYSYNDSSDSRN